MEEIWKPIKGYEGYYEVSNHGRVKRLGRIKKASYGNIKYEVFLEEKILKQSVCHLGYKYVGLTIDKQSKRIKIHRLVAENFIDNPNNYNSVDHINAIKSDNNVSNLRWCSRGQNTRFAWELGIFKRHGVNNGRSKINEEIALKIKQLLLNKVKQVDICKELGVSPEIVCHINNGRTWKHVKL